MTSKGNDDDDDYDGGGGRVTYGATPVKGFIEGPWVCREREQPAAVNRGNRAHTTRTGKYIPQHQGKGRAPMTVLS